MARPGLRLGRDRTTAFLRLAAGGPHEFRLDTHTKTPPGAARDAGAAIGRARVGGYRIERLLGRGGMGEVYEAVDERLGRVVALKRIAAERRDDGEARARFWREARALASVRHEGLVAIYEIGEDPTFGLFIAMERVEGAPLSRLLEAGVIPVATVVQWVIGAAEALGAAHAAGLTHRDVKPSNLIVEVGRVRVVDFGLARRMHGDDELTAVGTVLGTPSWMAPEQLASDVARIGPPSDVFALGMVLYRALSGTHPFARETPQATALAIAGGIKRPLAEVAPELPQGLVEVVERALAPAPADRYPDGTAFSAALREQVVVELAHDTARVESLLAKVRAHEPAALTPSAPSTRRSTAWRLGLAVVAGGAALGWALSGAEAERALVTDVVSTAHSAGEALVLPPRPVLLVVGFAAGDEARADADVVAEVMRVRLGEVDGLTSVPLATAESLLPDMRELSWATPATRYARSDRRLGHVDLVLRGRYERDGTKSRAFVELVDTRSGTVSASLEAAADSPVTLAEVLAGQMATRLGLAPSSSPARLSRAPKSWTALISARRAVRSADLGSAREHLAWALAVDPTFVLAKVEELSILRTEGGHADLIAKGEALLAEGGLPPYQHEVTTALVALARGETEAAVRRLDALCERYPFELQAPTELMGIRAKDEVFHDSNEVERLARRVLEVAPRDETAASRFVRAVGNRGRVAEAQALYERLGIPRDDETLKDVWAEIDLFSGRFEAAAAGFTAVLVHEPGNVYAEHMAIVSELLGGRCQEAAQAAMARIERITRLGKESLLDWTYSLGAQALICAEAWDALSGVLDRWSAYSRSGRLQGTLLRERVALVRARGDERARLAQRWVAMVASPERFPELDIALISLFGRVAVDISTIEMFEDRAKRAALDLAVSAPDRLAWRYLERALRARRLLVAGRPADEVRAAYASTVWDWSEVQGEGEASGLVEAMVRRAEAMEELGDLDAARGEYAAVVALGYPRLWVNDVYVTARGRLAAIGAR